MTPTTRFSCRRIRTGTRRQRRPRPASRRRGKPTRSRSHRPPRHPRQVNRTPALAALAALAARRRRAVSLSPAPWSKLHTNPPAKPSRRRGRSSATVPSNSKSTASTPPLHRSRSSRRRPAGMSERPARRSSRTARCGEVTVRVPPDRLDTLVLQLRGIGDLKSQSLEAEDVSKKYTDLESQLRAARAMEERLIAIIKEGKGQIKDLLAAEKELGVWRTKVEQIVGEMKYYDNLVAMATLNLTLIERDIATPATAHESENVDAGIESEDVEKARAAALKAIEEA